MSSAFEIVDPTRYDGWDQLVVGHRDHSVFHSAAWARVLVETYGYEPVYFLCAVDGHLQAMMPLMHVESWLTGRRAVGLPFSDYGGILLGEGQDVEGALSNLAVHGWSRRWKHIELRGGGLERFGLPSASTFLLHEVDLTRSEDDLFASFAGSTRRNIKKALKNKVEVEIGDTNHHVREYYRLHCLTRKRHGVPPQPWKFFENIYRFLLADKRGFLALAKSEDRTIAGAIFLNFGDTALYKFGASDREYQHLRANNLLMWTAIRRYCRGPWKRFCFGRTDPENEGLRKFKSSWGGIERKTYYFKYDCNQQTFVGEEKSAGRRYSQVLRRLPVGVLRGIGTKLYHHMG